MDIPKIGREEANAIIEYVIRDMAVAIEKVKSAVYLDKMLTVCDTDIKDYNKAENAFNMPMSNVLFTLKSLQWIMIAPEDQLSGCITLLMIHYTTPKGSEEYKSLKQLNVLSKEDNIHHNDRIKKLIEACKSRL